MWMIKGNGNKREYKRQRCAIYSRIKPKLHSDMVSVVGVVVAYCSLLSTHLLNDARICLCVCNCMCGTVSAPLWMIDASSCNSIRSHIHSAQLSWVAHGQQTTKSDSLSSFLTWTRRLLLHEHSLHAFNCIRSSSNILFLRSNSFHLVDLLSFEDLKQVVWLTVWRMIVILLLICCCVIPNHWRRMKNEEEKNRSKYNACKCNT